MSPAAAQPGLPQERAPWGLSLSLLISGSAHLGLFALLLLVHANSLRTAKDVIWVDFAQRVAEVATPAPKVARPAIPAPAPVENIAAEAPAAPTESSTGLDSVNEVSADSGALVAVDDPYRRELEHLLRSRLKYPMMALRLKQQGRVLVRFVMDRDGRVLKSEIVQGAPFDVLNRSALELVDGISGLKPFPTETREQARQFVIPIEYKM